MMVKSIAHGKHCFFKFSLKFLILDAESDMRLPE